MSAFEAFTIYFLMFEIAINKFVEIQKTHYLYLEITKRLT